MKTVMRGALALVLLASTAQGAFAQEQGERRGREARGDGAYNPAMRASTRNNPDNARPPREPPPAPPAQVAPQAQAQPPAGEAWQGGGRRRGGDGGRPDQPPAQSGQGDRRRGDPGGQRPSWQGQGQAQGQGWQGQGWQGQSWQGQSRQGQDGRNHGQGRNDNRPRDDRHDGNRDRDWGNPGWNPGGDHRARPDRQPRPRYDRGHYGQNYSSGQRYGGYAYRPPSGFYIRSWSYGDLLPRSWWSGQYRLNDWWSYGLPVPPIGYEYVRVGDDVLLVDMYSGRVVQVIRDVFW